MMKRLPILSLVIWHLTAFASSLVVANEVDFNRDIRPILSRHCIACHGPDEAHRKADFRIDVREEALYALEPGDVDSSEVFMRIVSDDEDRMPPIEHADGLSDSEKELIKKWINEGAHYAKHWAFVSPVRPRVPALDPSSAPLAQNEIDHFIARKLHANQLQLSPQASPARLIRRLALDLTGLPPTIEQVQRFEQSPNNETYEKIVDELLASPAYGEHWAAMWLDLARYADTTGYASDQARTIWPWRDWVIRAFNENMPYDQFTLEQIAGDLLPNATESQRLATAFHRNTLNNTEGGTNDEEFRIIAVKDRVNTTVNVWMGLTMRCAECHTHKYDPISQKEYYQVMAFFNQTADTDKNDFRPTLKLYPDEHQKEVAVLEKKIQTLQKRESGVAIPWLILHPASAISKATEGATLEIQDDGSVVAEGNNPDFDTYEIELPIEKGTYYGMRLEILRNESNKNQVGRHPNGSFALNQITAELTTPTTTKTESEKEPEPKPLKFSNAYADHTQTGHDIRFVIANKPNKKGWAVAGPEGYTHDRFAAFQFSQPLVVEDDSTIRIRLVHDSHWAKTNIGRFRLSITPAPEVNSEFELKANIAKQIAQLERKKASGVPVPVMEELPTEKKRDTHVMIRGSYLQPGEKVEPALLGEFPMPTSLETSEANSDQQTPANRLAVARWLLNDSNPLTARVTVNRFWARIFGTGIVETEEDFGTQSTPPSHPELLDWLAVDFREQGWNVKRLLKQMVMSGTYRQTGLATQKQLELDPRNQLLSRGPRFRLRAEVIRDQALAVSGLLSKKMHGPPVYPPNPVKSVRSAFQGETVWRESKGEDRYRRAIYTYLKRSSPHPLFDTFDMATREVCNLRRIRTNTPLQSFMTLNGAGFVEAANAMAKTMRKAGKTPSDQIAHGFEIAVFRKPTTRQLETLTELYHSTRDQFANSPAEARTMAAMGEQGQEKDAIELAALTVVANVILNLDTLLTK